MDIDFVSTNPSYTFKINRNRKLTAVFTSNIPVYTITATIDPAGSGTVTGAGQYQEGAQATITATPADGYTFSGWVENGTTVSNNASYTFTVTGNRALVAGFAVAKPSRLPAGYTEVEYISNPSKGYIRSLGLPNSMNTYKWELEIEITKLAAGAIFGNRYARTTSTSTTRAYNYLNVTSAGKFFLYIGNGKSGTVSVTGTGKKTIVIDVPKKIFSVNGVSETLSVSSSSANSGSKDSALFALNDVSINNNGVATTNYGMTPVDFKLFSLKLTNSSTGELYREYVPCTDSSGAAGVYELQTGVFYTAYDSSKPLTAGPAV